MNIHEILQGVRDGSIELAKAEELLKDLPYEDIGFAKLDHHRELRSGFGEVIYCAGKQKEHLVEIYRHFAARSANVLGTRASREQYEAVKKELPEVTFDPVSEILKLQKEKAQETGCIAVCTGGTSLSATGSDTNLRITAFRSSSV